MKGTTFDVAVSFSGAQRHLVKPVVRACEHRGLTVFLDEDHAVELWGRNLIEAMRDIYGGNQARYFIPFISQEYLRGPYPMDEFRTAQTHAIGVHDDTYILPIRMGEVEIPPTLLNPAHMYLQFEHYDVESLAEAIAARVGTTPAPVPEAVQVRLPKLPPSGINGHEVLETALVRVGDLFEQAAGQLTTFGVRCLVRRPDLGLRVRVERHGSPACELWLRYDHTSGPDRVLMSFAWPRITDDSHNGHVSAVWNSDTQQPALRFLDFGPPHHDRVVTQDELFHLLWDKIVNYLEQSASPRW